MRYKAISIMQSWASACFAAEPEHRKRIETRSWPTRYRGPLVICASAGRLPRKERLNLIAELSPFALAGEFADSVFNYLPFGCAIGSVVIVDCLHVETLRGKVSGEELAQGDYTPGRFGFVFRQARLFTQPIKCKGALGIFDLELPDDVKFLPPNSARPLLREPLLGGGMGL